MPTVQPYTEKYRDCLRDESRLVGTAEAIALPECEEEVRDVLRAAHREGRSVTAQGMRTGIVGGAVPMGGLALSLSRMHAMTPRDEHCLVVQPGATLSAVQAALAPRGSFFPPDPTETTASVGGMIATNASGALSFRYGPTRRWVSALRVVLADGALLVLRRGEHRASGRRFTLVTDDGHRVCGDLPAYRMPNTKNAAGYYVEDDMDLVDLFIGMEGTLGVITEADLRVAPLPGAVCALTIFLPSEAVALALVRLVRGESLGTRGGVATPPVSMEFFNAEALDLVREWAASGRSTDRMPALRPHHHTAVALEFHGADEADVEAQALAAMEAAVALGGNDEDTWYATDARGLALQKTFRHAVPEAVNQRIDELRRRDPAITKLGTDMSVPDAALEETIAMYRRDLARAELQAVAFGHVGNNHVHVNILPQSREAYARGRALYQDWAARVVALGGSVSAEHGIGVLKTGLLRVMYGEEGISQMRALKRTLDPAYRLNPGKLFDIVA